jgi:hypothetical protein
MIKRPLCFAILAAALTACGGNQPADPDPRAIGASSFATPVAAQGGVGTNAGEGPIDDGRLHESPGFIPRGEVSARRDATLFVLNEHRGLLAIDTAVSPPAVVAELPLAGRAVALFLDGTSAYAVLAGSEIVAIDIAVPTRPLFRDRFGIRGEVVGARLRGKLIDLVVRGGGDFPSAVLTVDIAAGAARQVGRVGLPIPGWIDQFQIVDNQVYLAVTGGRGWNGTACVPLPANVLRDQASEGCSQLVVVDLGQGTVSAPVDVRGRVAPKGFSHHAGVLRAVLYPEHRTKTPDGPQHRDALATFRAGLPGELVPLATFPLPSGTLGSEAPGFRFTEERLYLVTRANDRPIAIVDLARPEAPSVVGALPAGIHVQEILAATPTRLLAHVAEGTPMPCPSFALALYDTTDGANPKMMGRLPLGPEMHQYGGRLLANNVVLMPYFGDRVQGFGEFGPESGVQVVDVALEAGTLTSRGRVLLGQPGLGELVGEGDQLYSLTAEHLQAFAITNRDAPVAHGTVALAPWVVDVKFAAGKAITLVQDPRAHTFQLALAGDELASPTPAAGLTFVGQPGRLFVAGPFVYHFWHATRRDGRGEPRLDVFEFTGAGLTARSSSNLGQFGSIDFGPENAGEGSAGSGVRQIKGTTFLLPMRRLPVAECNPPPPMEGGSSPGSRGICSPPLLPAIPPPEPPPAAAIDESAPVQAQKAAAPCPAAAADLLVIDAANPDRPEAAALVRIDGAGEFGPSVVEGAQVFVAQIEGQNPPDGRVQQLRTYVVPIDLGNAQNPLVGPRVNVPGPFLAARPADQTWFTSELLADAAGKPSGIAITALYHAPGAARAYLQRSLRFEGGVSGPVVDGATAYVTVKGELVAVDLAGPEAPSIISRTQIPDATVSGHDWADAPGPAILTPPTTTTEAPRIAGDIHQIVGQHAFVLRQGREMLVFDVREPTFPRLRNQKVATPRGAHPVRLAPRNRAVIPRAEMGFAVVPLSAPASEAPACHAVARMAADAITSAASSVPQCTTSEDCKLINDVGFACVDCYHLFGSDAVRAAVLAQAAAINQICDRFENAGCQVIPSGCPAPSSSFACVAGKCVSGESAVPVPPGP